MPADSATSTTGSEYLSTATVTKMAPMMTPIVAESQIHQAPQPSAHLPNDPDRIYKTRSDIPEAANPIALATEESASDMVISGCQTQQDSIKASTPKSRRRWTLGVDIAKELVPIKNFVYDSDQFTFNACIAIDGIYDLPTKCIVVYDKNDMLQIHDISGGSVSLPHQNDTCPDNIQRMFICTSSEEDTDELLTCFMDILGDEEAKEFYTIDH
ncbi:hypothetical protein BASA60_001301 [Batrachochytrium salamandrivorans]|nr:hypothetical protein BASA60_001301 [Batrachochytrium salamandrivorans]